MTFKKIVKGFIERDSAEWIEKLLTDNGISFKWTHIDMDDIELEKSESGYLYTCKVEITNPDYTQHIVEVGGAIDDFDIYHSVVWDSKHRIIWMSVATTRADLGIKELKLA